MSPAALVVDGVPVAALDDGAGMRPVDSPRPVLHPVRTLGGALVSEAGPDDHVHHVGVSLALPDVDGTSYWGGRTYVRDVGSVLLANHGRQSVTATTPTADGVRQEVVWHAADGTRQADETRDLRATSAPAGGPPGWVLDWRSEVRPAHDLSIGSPATNGRPGAFYGGWFWRTPVVGGAVATADGTGVDRAHGSRSPWLLVAGADPEGRPVALLAVQVGVEAGGPDDAPLPWFVRTEEYTGFGPALAHHERRRVAAGESFVVHLRTLVLDEVPPDPAALAAALVAPGKES